MRRARRAWPAFAAGTLLAAVAGGCGGSGDEPRPTALSRALAPVRDTPQTESYVEFGDAAAARRLIGLRVGPDNAVTGQGIARWQPLLGVGGRAEGAVGRFTDVTGVAPQAADALLTAGQLPDGVSVVLGGLDVARVRARLHAAGLRERDGVLVSSDARGVPPDPYRLGAAVVRGEALAFGPTVAAVTPAVGGGRTLAEARLPRATARCLGDVVAAELVAGPHPFRADVPSLGLGVARVRVPTAPVREVVCAAAGDSGGADRLVAALRRGLGPHGRLRRNQGPVRAFVRAARVARADSDGVPMARAELVLTAQQQAGFLFDSLRQGDVPGLGGPSR